MEDSYDAAGPVYSGFMQNQPTVHACSVAWTTKCRDDLVPIPTNTDSLTSIHLCVAFHLHSHELLTVYIRDDVALAQTRFPILPPTSAGVTYFELGGWSKDAGKSFTTLEEVGGGGCVGSGSLAPQRRE